MFLEKGSGTAVEQKQWRLREAEEQLGRLDGYASGRCLKVIETFITEYMAYMGLEASALRQAVTSQARCYCKSALRQARIRTTFLSLAVRILPLLYPFILIARRLSHESRSLAPSLAEYQAALDERCRLAEDTVSHCRAILTRRDQG